MIKLGTRPAKEPVKEFVNKIMQKTYLISVCAGVLALCQGVHAAVLEISLDPNTHLPSDVPFNDIGGNPVSVFGWLEGEILSWNNFVNDPHLPDPTTGHTRYDDLQGDAPTIPVVAGDYVVAHYGVGPNDAPGDGGGLVAYYVDADLSLTLPDTGPGPHGTGGIGFIDVFDHVGETVPDGAATGALLLIGTVALGVLRRGRS
jgi:hypothetical protein